MDLAAYGSYTGPVVARTAGGIVEFGVLGPVQVLAGGEPVALGSAQQRAVLAMVMLEVGGPVSRDRLVDGLWGERPPASAAHAVQVYVSAIRKILRAAGDPPVRLAGSPAGYVLEADPEQVDARRFARLIDHGQRALAADPLRARNLFEQALSLWRGPPLADLVEFDFAAREARRLEELRAAAVEGVVEARLALGEHDQVLGQISGLVAANPLRERPRRLSMLALYRLGRHAEALAAYRDACAALDEIGLQPSPELRALEQAILRHDPSLAAPRPDDAAESSAVGTSSVLVDGAGVTVASAVPTVETVGRENLSASLGRRKVVTALFCDVTGSTALGEELDPEALHGVMNRYWRELRTVIERHGGAVEKFMGDAVMAVFGIPRVQEDDALRAVRAAAEIRDRLPAVAAEVGVTLTFRTAVNTGLVLVGDGANLAIGDAINVAARLEQIAAPGEILLGEDTFLLVRDAVEVESLEPLVLRGKSEPVSAFRLVSVDPVGSGVARRFDVPLVGRERELGVVRAAWERVVEESGCHLFTLLGAAGVGKSRLVSELFAELADEATVVSGRCLHYGDGITFWPLIEALSPLGAPAQAVLEHLGTGGVAVPEELFFEVRELLESLASERPVILHIDDLQWAESMLLDLIDHVVGLSRGAAILVLCSARPELLEDHPTWGGGKLNATTALLEPLPAAHCEVLLDQLADGLPPGRRAQMIAASAGNPLFLEEMATLVRERGTVEVPPTIQALLAARLERLPVEERELLERGAIEGEVFHQTAVRALASHPAASDVERSIANLIRKELLRPHPPTLHDDRAFRFRHLLIRDAAYDGVPKTMRANLHARFASWLEANAHDLAELDEIAGWHLEQAVRYQRELGQTPDPSLAKRAATHLHAAGNRAGARGDSMAATNLLERAHEAASYDDTLRPRIGVDLAEQLIEAGDLTRARELLSTAEGNTETAAHAALTRFEWLSFARPDDAVSTIETELPRILKQLADDGDERGLARAHFVASLVHQMSCNATLAAEQELLAAEHARNRGDEGLRARALGHYLSAIVKGPPPVSAIQEQLDQLEQESLGPFLGASTVMARGELARFEARFDESRRLIREASEQFRALGIHTFASICQMWLAETEIAAQNPAGALAGLLEADETLAEMGDRGVRCTVQAMMARVYELLGDQRGAYAALELTDGLGAPDDVINHIITHPVRARLALSAGDMAAAEEWARSAVEYACQTDFTTEQAHTRLELARVLATLEHDEEARSQARIALDLYRAKGDQPGAAEANALLLV